MFLEFNEKFHCSPYIFISPSELHDPNMGVWNSFVLPSSKLNNNVIIKREEWLS